MVISLIALLIGFCIDLIIGDPHSIPHPVVFIGKLISVCEKALRKVFPKNPRGEFIAGIFLVIIVISVSSAIPFFILYFTQAVSVWLRLALESIMCWQILALKSLKSESMKVYKSLKKGDVEEARYNVSMIVGRDTKALSDIGVTKAAVETVAENTSDGIIAPMMFCAAGGAWLGLFYKAINTMDSMIAYKNEKYLYFGRFAAKLDDIANYIPSRLSALIMIAVCPVLRFNTKNAWKIWRRDRRKHASPNSAQTESVCAGALEIRLAGDARYHGILHKKDFIGDDIRAVEYEDIRRANRLLYATAITALVLFTIIKASIIFALKGFIC
ncbi:MAG: adenosylcobinamide-phosphate synthase CbiB [Eubacteriales bacterium]